MQSFSWYLQRIKAMSASEVLWRLQGKYIDIIDRYKIQNSIFPSLGDLLTNDARQEWEPKFRLSDIGVGEWINSENSDEILWCKGLTTSADQIVEHKLSYFHLDEHHHGNPIQWNKDHGNNITAPIHLAQKVDYRDFNETGDCKLVWEPNRHQHLVVLARAFRATGNQKYAESIKAQILSWLDQCPYGYGMNWRSPMELSIRLINWVWAIDLTWESSIFSNNFRDQVIYSIYLHLHEVTRKYSRGSSANNHLIGEAAGVFITANYFPQLPNAQKWQDESYDILCREIDLQTFEDGCNKEIALEYQFFVIQFFLLCGLVGKLCGREFPKAYWNKFEKQLCYIGHLHEGGGAPVFYGDADDGFVLNLGDPHTDPHPLLGAGVLLFDKPHFKDFAPNYTETLRWLFGKSGEEQFAATNADRISNRLTSHAFHDSGFYLLQSGHHKSDDRISVLFDCGPLGFGSIAAHGHADALSFTLTAFNENILIDPGTYDYFTYPEWRHYFKSTIAHNTIEIDGMSQSEILGLFLWGKRANATCLEWQPDDNGGTVAGEHDGYSLLKDPVIHRRKVQLKGNERVLLITDELICRGRHTIRVPFHFAPICKIKAIDSTHFRFTTPNGSGDMHIDECLSATLFRGYLRPTLGWASNGYHKKQPTPTLLATAEISGNTKLSFKISLN